MKKNIRAANFMVYLLFNMVHRIIELQENSTSIVEPSGLREDTEPRHAELLMDSV